MVVMIVLSIAFPVCFIVLLIGCLDCLFRRKKLEAFRSRDTTDARNSTAFSVDIVDVASDPVTIEPLPDILSKVTTAPPLRPQITFAERGKQETTLPVSNVQRPFPRDHLTYLNEIGSGWFGKVIESEAVQIMGGSYKSHVVVKMLKDDASKFEQKQFLDEINAFRNLDDRNLMHVLGQCTEAVPFLVILEFAAHGNFKSYLIQNSQDLDEIITKNRFINFALDAASGLVCLHKNDYIHNDLAARNCLLMSDYTLKIGDYGISDHLFKNEYYNTGSQLLPIRWMAPETLTRADGVWTTKSHDKSSDMWSFGILLWEICSLGEYPYSMLTDEAVLQGVVLDRLVLPSEEDLKIPFKDRMWSVIAQCLQNPKDRLDVQQAFNSLEQLSRIRLDTMDTISDFEQKWNQLKQNQDRISSNDTDLGSRIALAGSFITDGSSSSSDKSSPHDDEMLDGTKRDGLIIEMGVDNTYTNQDENSHSVPIVVHTNANPSLGTFRPHNILDTSEHQHQVIVHVENELARTSASPSHQMPTVSPEQLIVMNTMPDFQGQSSISQFSLLNSSVGSEYITASEPVVPSSHQVEEIKDLSSVNKDFTLDVEQNTLQVLLDDNLQEPFNNSNDVSKFDSFLQTEDDDFSEFVRTSPTSPSVDFTDFASADKDELGDLKTENNFSLEIITGNSTTEENVAENSFSDFDVTVDDNSKADNDSNSFSDFVISAPPISTESTNINAVELNTTVSNADAALTQTLTGKDILLSLNSDLLDSDMSFFTSAPKSVDRDANISNPTPFFDSRINGELNDFEQESGTRSAAEDMSLEKMLVEKVVPDQNQNIFSSEQIPSNMSSLASDTSHLFDHFNLETTSEMPLQSEELDAFTDLQKHSVDMNSLEPLHAHLPTVTDVLEESNSEIFHALEDNSSAFSTADFLDLSLPSNPAESTDPASINDDARS